jgi:hypothetical protein
VGISHDTTSKTYGVYADSHLNLVCTKDASLVICNGRNAGWQSGIDRHLIDIHLFGEYNFSIPRDGVGIMTKPLRGDAISNP